MATLHFLFLTALFMGCLVTGNSIEGISSSTRQSQRLNVQLDVRQVQHLPELQHFWRWAQNGRKAMVAWYPWIMNELKPQHYTHPSTVIVEILNKNDGIAYASGNKISVSSSFIKTIAVNDLGVLIHELVHVIQFNTNRGVSGNRKPSWVIEGVADYIRWPYYDRWPLNRFPKPNVANGYTQSYRVTAGFFFWIEKHRRKGFVRSLHNQRSYNENIFRDLVGKPVRDLWADYLRFNSRR